MSHCSAHQPLFILSRCNTAWRGRELSGDVTPFLRQAAEAVSVRTRIVDVDVALVVKRPKQLIHPLECRGDEVRLLILAVGPVGNMNIDPDAGQLLFGQRLAAGEPIGRVFLAATFRKEAGTKS